MRRIVKIEAEMAALREELAQLRDEAQATVAATHRQYRRDLVPVQNTIAVFIDAQMRKRTP